MLDNNPPPDIGSGLQTMGQTLAASSTPPDGVLNALASINTILNAAIGLTISLLVTAFLVYLIRWVVADEGSESQKTGARGALRATMAMVLALNIWSIMYLLQVVASLSPVAEYATWALAFVLFAAWSIFSITDSVVTLIGQLTDWLLDRGVAGIRRVSGKSEIGEWSPRGWSKAIVRVIILVVLGVVSFLSLNLGLPL